MCGRFYIAPEAHLEKSFAHVQLKLFQDLPIKYSGEIFPTDIVPVFIMENGIRMAKPMIWGFPQWGGRKGVIFNARQETALTKPFFSRSRAWPDGHHQHNVAPVRFPRNPRVSFAQEALMDFGD